MLEADRSWNVGFRRRAHARRWSRGAFGLQRTSPSIGGGGRFLSVTAFRSGKIKRDRRTKQYFEFVSIVLSIRRKCSVTTE